MLALAAALLYSSGHAPTPLEEARNGGRKIGLFFLTEPL